MASTGTKHSLDCSPPGRGPGFRRTPDCPRCDELIAGATPREAHAGIDAIKRRAENERLDEIGRKRHFESGEHLAKCQHGNPTAPTTCYEW